MLSVDWKGLILPFAYVVVLLGTFVTFSTVYRKRKAAQSANLAPWFPPHLQRNIYLSLLHLDHDADGKEKSPRVPDSVLRAALLRRAVEDIQRIVQIRSAKQACTSLLQRGSVGDDLMQSFQRAEKEIEAELRDVVMEANALAPNWGQSIFQTANEVNANILFRRKIDQIEKQTDIDRDWWNRRRGEISDSFMKELDQETTGDGSNSNSNDNDNDNDNNNNNKEAANAAPTGDRPTTSSSDEPVLVDGTAPATQ